MAITLPRRLLAVIHDKLQGTYPDEGGGFLLGQANGGSFSIVDVYPVDNVFAETERFHRYAMTPQDWARLEDEADAQGLSLVGYYHSHPDSPPVPSVYDRDHALPNFAYIIVGVYSGQHTETRAWRLAEDRASFDEQELVIE